MPDFATPPTLNPGDSGDDVVLLQRFLLALEVDPASSTEGVFDERTADGVTEFKTSRGLPADPVVDPDTWVAFFEAIGPLPNDGMSSNDLAEFPAMAQVIAFGQSEDIEGYIAESLDQG